MCRMQGRLGVVSVAGGGSVVAGRRQQRPICRSVRQSPSQQTQQTGEEVAIQSRGSGNITPLFTTDSLNSTHGSAVVEEEGFGGTRALPVVIIVQQVTQQVTDVLRSLVSTDEETVMEMIEGSEEPYPMSSIHEKREKVHNMLADWDRFA